MKAKVFISNRIWHDEILSVSGSLDQSILQIQEYMKENDHTYHGKDFKVEKYNDSVYRVLCYRVPEHWDQNYKFEISFIISEYEIETED